MASSFTTNKVLEKPGNGDYVDTWNVPVNGDLDIIDQAFGGITALNATGGSATLTEAQYRSLILNVTGAISASVTYTIPSGKGGQWIVRNTTTDATGGPHSITIASAGAGTSVVVSRSGPVGVYSDGTNIRQFSNLGTVTSVDVAGGTTGLTTSGGPVTSSGTITLAGTLVAANGGTGLTSPGSNGNVLTSNGTAWVSSPVASGGALIRAPQILTSGTSYTTPSNCTKIYVEIVGGGGGGGSAANGAGGGAGAYAAKYFSVSASTAYTYAIGQGGATGTAGTDSSFIVGGTTVTAGGGAAGSNGLNASGGAGGTATNGDINTGGGGGQSSMQYSTSYFGGVGGSSFFGGGGKSPGGAGLAYGSGGAGQGSTGVGANGVIRVWEYT